MRHWPPAPADLPEYRAVHDPRRPARSRAGLAALLPITEDELADLSVSGRQIIACRLERALRAERRRGRAGHWTYDLNRHLALKQALAAERAALALLRR